jgi:hypothetical protein
VILVWTMGLCFDETTVYGLAAAFAGLRVATATALAGGAR